MSCAASSYHDGRHNIKRDSESVAPCRVLSYTTALTARAEPRAV